MSAHPRAELAVVGALLANQKRIAEVMGIISSEDFSSDACRIILETIVALDAGGTRVDSLVLVEELQANGSLAKVGGVAFLAELDTAAPTAANVLEYARIVAENSTKRKLLKLADETRAKLTQADTGTGAKVSEVLAATQASLGQIEARTRGGGLVHIAEGLGRSIELYDRTAGKAGGVTGVPTGFAELDQLTTGMHGGDLWLLAARPSTGKTALSMNMAAHVAMGLGQPVAVFSLEMPVEQLCQRLISARAHIPLRMIRAGEVSMDAMSRFNEAAATIQAAPLYVDDTGGLTIHDLRARLRRLISSGIKVVKVVVDYLQLMRAGVKVANEEQELTIVSHGLKSLAKEFGLPVLALAQLNRKAEERDGPPRLGDLRGSGSLEQDADTVLLLHEGEPPEADPGVSLPTPVDCIVAKQRNGPPGTVRLLRRGSIVLFEAEKRDTVPAEKQPEIPLPTKARGGFTENPEENA